MQPTALLTTVPSDSHMWNLIFMQLFLEERGYQVSNLGACVPFELLEASASRQRPDLIVVSTVNGHGYLDGLELSRRLASMPSRDSLHLVLGGKLGVNLTKEAEQADRLRAAGFDDVFYGVSALQDFEIFLRSIGHPLATIATG